MKSTILRALIALLLVTISCSESEPQPKFMTVSGSQFISPDGEPVILKGTNLGNWLLPEGYMFKFQKTNAAWMIDESFRQLVGPDQTDAFWQEYLDSYIKEDDIAFLKSIGANHIRVPFNYRLFTGEHYMGGQDLGFTYLDKVVDWSARHGLWVCPPHCRVQPLPLRTP